MIISNYLMISTTEIEEPAYYSSEIDEAELKKLKKIFDKIEKDPKAYEFLKPVDFAALGLWH